MNYIEFLQERAFSAGYAQRMFDEQYKEDKAEELNEYEEPIGPEQDSVTRKALTGAGGAVTAGALGYGVLNSAKMHKAKSLVKELRGDVVFKTKSGLEYKFKPQDLSKLKRSAGLDKLETAALNKYENNLKRAAKIENGAMSKFKGNRRVALLAAGVGLAGLGAGALLKYRMNKKRNQALAQRAANEGEGEGSAE